MSRNIQFRSVAQSCPTLGDRMNHSTPSLPVHHQLLEFTQTHVHWIGDAIQPFHPLSVPFSSCPQSLPASGSFPMSQFFESGGQSIGVSALASVLPMNTQDWFPLGWTGWTSLQSKGPSRGFSNTTVQKHHYLITILHLATFFLMGSWFVLGPRGGGLWLTCFSPSTSTFLAPPNQPKESQPRNCPAIYKGSWCGNMAPELHLSFYCVIGKHCNNEVVQRSWASWACPE